MNWSDWFGKHFLVDDKKMSLNGIIDLACELDEKYSKQFSKDVRDAVRIAEAHGHKIERCKEIDELTARDAVERKDGKGK